MTASFLSSRVKNLNIGVSGYTEDTDVLDAIGSIKSSGTIKSTVVDGIAPLEVASTTLVENLNVDKLDGQDGSYYLSLDNATGNFSTGDLLYASSETTIEKLSIGSSGSLLTVFNGIPSWEEITAEDLGGISGIDVYDDDKTPNFIANVTKFLFRDGLLAEQDETDEKLVIIDLDLSSITPEDIGAITGIGILEEGDLLGEVQNINFVSDNITASVDTPGTAIITFSENPSFSKITLTAPDGNPPITVSSSTLVNNLNADLLDGRQGTYYTDASNLSSGFLPRLRLDGEYDIDITGSANTATNSDYVNIVAKNDDVIYKVSFTDTTGNYRKIYTDDDTLDFTYNPSSGELSASVIISSIPDGTAPLQVTSTTLVDNLNADLLDNQQGSYYLDLENSTGVLAETNGGTGNNSYVSGDILYASDADTLSKLPIGADNTVLYVDGTSIVWKSLSAGDVGAITGITVQNSGNTVGTVDIINFDSNLDALVEPSDLSTAKISLSDNVEITSITTTNDSYINGLRVGKGGGNGETNTVLGYDAMLSNTGGSNNISVGYQSLYLNENGDYNVSMGVQALFNSEGSNNTGIGHNALYTNQIGNYNTALGSFIGSSISASRNIIIGTGTDQNNVFDTPNLNTDYQLAIGHNVDGISSYWIIGNENYYIGLGVNDPQYKLDIDGDINLTGSIYQNGQLFESGINVYDDALEVGLVSTIKFGSSLSAQLDENDNKIAIIDVDISLISPGDIGAVEGINVLEEGTLVGLVQNIDFISDNITASIETEGTAKVTLTDDPEFNSVSVTNNVSIGTAIDIIAYNDIENGTLSFEGSAGQLFSITNNLTSGSIFSINDVSGIPSIDVDADGRILLAPYSTTDYVGIGTTTPTEKLEVSGNVKIYGTVTATDFNSTSDVKLKTNIQPIVNPLEKITQIQGVTFNWIENNKPSIGVIANEIEKVLPELVSKRDVKTVNYNGLIGLLIECVKQQQVEIEELKRKIE